MPLVAHNELPSFWRLQQNGQEVLTLERAQKQDIRELHIGLLNMMPDAALTATEQQFIRLVGGCDLIAQFYVYPFSIPELHRGAKAEEHIRLSKPIRITKPCLWSHTTNYRHFGACNRMGRKC